MIFIFTLLTAFNSVAQNNDFCGVNTVLKKNYSHNKMNSFTPSIPDEVIDRVVEIPVVVHWIDKEIPKGDSLELVSKKVQSQIEALNRDYRGKDGGTDTKIQFCLATLDENDQELEIPGLDAVPYEIFDYSGIPYIATHTIEEELKPTTIWNRNDYLNIWVVPGIDFPGFGTKLGYANFPTSSTLPGISPDGEWIIEDKYFSLPETDGVVIYTHSFGNEDSEDSEGLNLFPEYNHGKVTSHEVGHWLGLFHTFQGTETLNSCELPINQGDFCIDTAQTNSPTFGCPTNNPHKCGFETQLDNFMEYTQDNCKNTFTKDQAIRMKTVLEYADARKNLPHSNKCRSKSAQSVQAYTAYPNPTSGIFQVRVSDPGLSRILLVDTAGRLVQEIKADGVATIYSVDITHGAAGIYILEYIRNDGTSIKQKILKF